VTGWAVLAGLTSALAVLVVWPARRLPHPGPGRAVPRRSRGRPRTAGRPRAPSSEVRPRFSASAADRAGRVPAPVLLDLVAEVIAGGAPVSRAVGAVGEALRSAGDPQAGDLLALAARLATGAPAPASRAPASPVALRLVQALDLSLGTGAGPVGLLRAAAQEERRAAAARTVQAARRLGVLVLLPTALCLLPAFLLLTVVPLAIGLALG